MQRAQQPQPGSRLGTYSFPVENLRVSLVTPICTPHRAQAVQHPSKDLPAPQLRIAALGFTFSLHGDAQTHAHLVRDGLCLPRIGSTSKAAPCLGGRASLQGGIKGATRARGSCRLGADSGPVSPASCILLSTEATAAPLLHTCWRVPRCRDRSGQPD